MQIEIYTPTKAQPLPPVEWNYTEVRQWVEDGLGAYKGRVYTDETISQAKADRATLNKLSKAIDAKRKELKAVYLTPYSEFEAQAKELVGMIDQQAREIDAQVKAYDEHRRAEKLERIESELYTPMIGDLAELVPYKKLHDPKWLNVTVSMTAISEALAEKIERITAGLTALDKLSLPEDVAGDVKRVFLCSFDLAEAIAEKDRILDERERMVHYLAAQNAARAAQESKKEITPPVEETPAEAKEPSSGEEAEAQPMQLDFRVWVTHAQMMALREFLRSSNIKYGKVPKESEESPWQ